MPAFLTKKQVYDWVTTGAKTIELRKGKSQNGDCIAFLNGQRQCVKGRILRKREGKLDEVLNAATYRKIVPTAKTLDEAIAFIKQLYQSTDGTFTAYEFQLNQNSDRVTVEEDERGIVLKPVPSPSDELGSLKAVFEGKMARQLLIEGRKEEVAADKDRERRARVVHV